MSGIGIFFAIVIVLLITSAIAWILFTQLRARRQGLPAPTLASYNPFAARSSARNYPSSSPSGIAGWLRAKFQALKNRRTAGGAYEEPLGGSSGGGAGLGGRGRRGFGPLDPDEAWDTRVGTEADAYGPGGFYEEQELGLHPAGAPYSASGYGGASPRIAPSLPEYGEEDAARGRSRGREAGAYIGGGQRGLDERYDEEMGRGGPRDNPFGDAAERSDLRGVSPRPIEMDATGRAKQGNVGAHEESPTERKSMFREDM